MMRELHISLWRMLFESESGYTKLFTDIIKDLGEEERVDQAIKEKLLAQYESGEFAELIDYLWELALGELRHRIVLLGFENFNKGNGLGYVLASQAELEGLALTPELIDVAVNMDAIPPEVEMEIRACGSKIGHLRHKINRMPSVHERKEMYEILLLVGNLFVCPRLESWDIAERISYLISNTNLDDLMPFLERRVCMLKEEELRQVAERLLLGFNSLEISMAELESVEYCFGLVWQLLPSDIREGLVRKGEDRLGQASDYNLFSFVERLRLVDGLDYLSVGVLGMVLDLHFSDGADQELLGSPINTNALILDLKRFGAVHLPEERFEITAEVVLDFYMKYSNYGEYGPVGEFVEAVRYIPTLLGSCPPRLLSCFELQVERLRLNLEIDESGEGSGILDIPILVLAFRRETMMGDTIRGTDNWGRIV